MKRIQVVDLPDQAVLVVEVVGHTEQPAARKDVTMLGVHTRFERLLTVRLTVRAWSTDVSGRVNPDLLTAQPGAGSLGGFRRGGGISSKWVEANEQRLPQPKIPPPTFRRPEVCLQ